MDSQSSVFSSAKRFFSGTLLSRFLGMLRDFTMAFCFGSAPQVALFMVAYRWANLFRRLFGEGNVQGGFIPQFEQVRALSEENAIQFYRDVRNALLITVGSLVAASMLVCWGISLFFMKDLFLMILLMMPGVLFLILYALNSSVLQCQKSFFLPAFAPALFNIIWIGSVLFLYRWELRSALLGLSVMILFAFAAQWGITAYPLKNWLGRVQMSFRNPFSPQVRALVKPFSFGVIGVGAAQINSALDVLFASWTDPSGPAYLWYAIRIQQLPLALLGIALTNAILPPLARAIQEGAFQRYQILLQAALQKSLLLMIPCTIGLLAFSEIGLDFLYGHGAFLFSDVSATSFCLQAYGLGLVPMAYTLLLANSYYAQKEYRWPMRCSLISILCNLIFNVVFVFFFSLGAASIALSTTLSSFCNCILLSWNRIKEVKIISLKKTIRITAQCIFFAYIAVWVDKYIPHQREILLQTIRLLSAGLIFGAGCISLYVRETRTREEY